MEDRLYRIATRAELPIVPVALDFASRTVRIFPPFMPTGDLGGDLATLTADTTGPWPRVGAVLTTVATEPCAAS